MEVEVVYEIITSTYPGVAGSRSNGIRITPLARIMSINLLGLTTSSFNHVDSGNILV